MASKIIRRVAIGAAAALCLTGAPVVMAATTAHADPTTTLTGVQATDAYRALTDRVVATGVIHGLRLSASETVGFSNGVNDTVWTSRLVIDPKRRLVSETDRTPAPGQAMPDLRLSGGGGDDCLTETVADGAEGKSQTYLTKAGDAQWLKVRKGSYPHAQKLKILGRSSARWERVPTKVSSTVAARSGRMFEKLAPSFLRNFRIESGTVSSSAAGSSYSLAYRNYWSVGTVEVTTTPTGVVTQLRRSERVTYEGAISTTTTSFAIAYGPQALQVPTRSTVVNHSRMVSACHALRTKDEARRLAESVKVGVNGYGARTAKRVRTIAKQLAPPREWNLRLTRSSIAGGVMIVGRHQLLKHPVVWAVVIRNGKAVRHQVR